MKTIFTIIVIAAVIVLGSKVIKAIFNLIKSAIKVVIPVATVAVLAILAIVNNPREAELISGLQSKEIRKEFKEYCAPRFKAALEAECQEFSGKTPDEIKSTVKEVIEAGQGDAEEIKARWEEKYSNDTAKEVKKEVIEETVETSDVEPGFHFETTTTTLPSSKPGFHFER